MPRRFLPSLLSLLVLGALPAAAPAVPTDVMGPSAPAKAAQPKLQRPSAPSRPRSLLWATVNVCDTQDAPDTIGIRGSMPGSGNRRERMHMRFQVEYRAADGSWRPMGSSGDSGWIAVGSGRYRARQSGRNFVVPPPQGGSVRLRATVTFEWRRGSRVVRRASRRTAGGHPGTPGADPPGYSAATCRIRA